MAQPFDEQPLFGTGDMTIDVAVSRTNPDTGKARTHGATGPWAPRDVAPGALWQSNCQVGNGDGTMPGSAADASRGAAHTGGLSGWQRGLARWPHGRLACNANQIGDLLECELVAPGSHHAVPGVGNHRGQRDAFPAQSSNLLQGDRSLGAERHVVGDRGGLPWL